MAIKGSVLIICHLMRSEKAENCEIINNIEEFNKIPYRFCFSTENWKRSSKEISFLMKLLNQFLDQTILKFMKKILKLDLWRFHPFEKKKNKINIINEIY